MSAAKENTAARVRLGRYELVTKIAAGGMAEVYAARVRGEGGFERLVAVKRMLPNLAEDERFAEMFLDEGRIAGNVESPHVVQILDVGRDPDGTLFIAMELVRGVALHRLLSAVARAGERVPAAIASAIVVQAAEGLGAAHEATTALGEPLHIVHRDVSPQNVLCGIDGRIRVADFGIARAVHRKSNTSTGELKGKLAYFAPEQLRAQPADAKSDVFALGVVAWECFAGKRLFQGEHPLATMERIRAHEAEALDALRSDVPAAAGRAIARTLAKDPEARTPSARAFADELRAALPPADGGALTAFVRRFAHEEIKALDERIKAALTGAQTVSIPAPPEPVTDVSGIVASGRTESLDAPTIVTPSANFQVSSLSRPLPPPPPPPRAEIRSETAIIAPAPPTRPWPWIAAGIGAVAIVGVALALALGGGGDPAPVATELPVGTVHGALPTYAPVPAAAPPPVAPAPTPVAADPPPVAVPAAPEPGDDGEPAETGRRTSRAARTETSRSTGSTAARRDDDDGARTVAPTGGAEPERRGGLRGRDSFLGEMGAGN